MKPDNVINHNHFFPQDFFPQDGTDKNEQRIDLCELSTGQYAVWVLETNISIYFNNYEEALSFVKNFMFARYSKVAVNSYSTPL